MSEFGSRPGTNRGSRDDWVVDVRPFDRTKKPYRIGMMGHLSEADAIAQAELLVAWKRIGRVSMRIRRRWQLGRVIVDMGQRGMAVRNANR